MLQVHGAVPALSARGYCIPFPIIWQAGIHRLPHQLSTAPQQRRPNPPNRRAKLAADTPNSLFRCATPAATIRLRRGASARRPARRAETIGSKLPKNPHGARSQGCGAEGSGCATSGVNEPGGRPSLGTLKKTSQHSKKTDTEGLRCPCRLMQRGLRAGSCATPPRAPDGESRKNALSGPNG